ncbi:hypothetical protein [Deinococcus yavapaiensis]|uniref:Uncharacterized protein n=1 Tax=Deinococcus yavapaiensis KR-236 TaxID=694435 RepID=A0A318SCI9_9DEIO|nr:hypothetical protein [Deinococcus yavapaiensis]PYE56571.1 hypothetical protein DES52_101376 [Deinococcus yavapaiensis KR-236]
MNNEQLTSSDRQVLHDMQAQLDRQHTTTIVAVTLGVTVGVAVATGVALWVLSKGRRANVVTDDPEAPLFV